GKSEGIMRFLASPHELVLSAEGKDVVTDRIVSTIMLVESCALAPINDIALEHNLRAAFIRIQAPTAVGEGVHVMDQVVADHRAFLNAKRINSTHVAQDGLADVVEVVELDNILTARRFLIAPVPTY